MCYIFHSLYVFKTLKNSFYCLRYSGSVNTKLFTFDQLSETRVADSVTDFCILQSFKWVGK